MGARARDGRARRAGRTAADVAHRRAAHRRERRDPAVRGQRARAPQGPEGAPVAGADRDAGRRLVGQGDRHRGGGRDQRRARRALHRPHHVRRRRPAAGLPPGVDGHGSEDRRPAGRAALQLRERRRPLPGREVPRQVRQQRAGDRGGEAARRSAPESARRRAGLDRALADHRSRTDGSRRSDARSPANAARAGGRRRSDRRRAPPCSTRSRSRPCCSRICPPTR